MLVSPSSTGRSNGPAQVLTGVAASRRARQLALGVWIERQIEAGRVESYAEMARILGVSRARVTQLVDLGLRQVGEREAWLAMRPPLQSQDGGGGKGVVAVIGS